ncbi:hypothetical protein [Variibacter gotjawalensis]|uniref:hypothetical protein n=1 Tax=Variibacter gotjawalensis TaxID=1333996 RepID=UPI000BBB40EC|nr:hypothetical protein [Variibacter gotjawalensis]NIK47067.1 hypothetical protein [Variibacter gotjawalensis]
MIEVITRTVRLSCEDDDEQSEIWERLYEQILSLLSRYGVDNAFGDGDCFLVDDNYGWKRHHVEVHQFHMFRPDIVAKVRSLLDEFPEWQIVMQIGVVGTEAWPNMGLTIRKHEIIEVLRREMLPEPFKNYQYPGARPGTEYD